MPAQERAGEDFYHSARLIIAWADLPETPTPPTRQGYHMFQNRIIALLLTLLVCTVTTASEAPGPKAYVILEITVHDPVMYEQYREAVEPVIESHGGRYVVRSGAKSFDNDPNSEVVSPEGEWYPDRIIVLEFDSKAQIQAFVNSPEYKAVAPLRHDSASTKSVVVNGYRGSQ